MAARKRKRVAIVTGAVNGIGRGIAKRLAEDGWEVVAADLKPGRKSAGIHPLATDVRSEAAIKELVEGTRKSFGWIDAIVSNAGVSEFRSLAECTLEDWNRVIATNLTPAFLLAKEAEKDLKKSKGAMILVASTRAHMSEPDTHAYSATKGGLVALTHSLAISMGPEVRVNCISPGWIDVSGGKLSKEDHEQHPAGRVGRPEDIGAAVAFLLSEAGFITGAELVVDGGMTRKMIYR
ncbi:SDR family oxidoreductase [Luteolibacter sp. GHJ8]|uniref:SDR family oxidoreductase n=1 Tax=Luteolibacter rhizosphaerae TaxID=2989719 RepID=A0ABT3G9X5_9BACT|nr:SDR family oxidoreductase [Luteolibacter rhizosphaerae]MCW1916646.1 SDR family oxidoreductase [Luteolibacter rhizosphaerae]